MSDLVLGDARPIHRLRRGIRFRILPGNLAEELFRFAKLLAGERGLSQPQFELRQKIVRRQIPFETVPLFALRIENDQRRRPLRAETLETLRMLFDMYLDRDEMLVDELRDAFIRVYLGIQPSACPSHRRGAKIEQNVFLLGSRVIQRRIYVFSPCNGHWLTSCHELR